MIHTESLLIVIAVGVVDSVFIALAYIHNMESEYSRLKEKVLIVAWKRTITIGLFILLHPPRVISTDYI